VASQDMPVPVTTTHPMGKGLACHRTLPSTGSMFSKLDADSATTAMEEKRIEQSVDWSERRAGNAPSSTPAVSKSEHAIVCKNLEFDYFGEDGLPLPGTFDRANATCSWLEPPGTESLPCAW
jgi:hypothetical protein